METQEKSENGSQHPRQKEPADLQQDHIDAVPTGDVEVQPPTQTIDGGYGWVCVACSLLINAHTWGIVASYGIFLSFYVAHQTFRGSYAYIGGLTLCQAVLTAPLATFLVKKFGTRSCLFTGIFFQTLGLVAASFAKEDYQIILSQGISAGWGIGLLFVGNVAITSQWFDKKRSFANAVVASGTGIGALVYSLSSQKMLSTIGLPWAFRVLAIVQFAVNLVASLLLRDRNKEVGSTHRPFSPGLMKRPEFLCLQVWSFLTTVGYTGLAFSVSPQAVSIGLSADKAALLNALYNLGQAIGRPIIGLVSDKVGRITVALISTMLSAIICFAFWLPSAYAPSKFGLLVFFNIASGAVSGVFWCTIAAVTTEVVGLPELPSALSMIWLTIVPSTMFAEPMALATRWHGPEDSFIPAQIFISAMFAGAVIPMWILRGWKIAEVEKSRQCGSESQSNGRSNGGGQAKPPDQAGERNDMKSESPWRPGGMTRRMFARKRV